ncbi:hypothetical protein P5V43_21425 [Mycobacteroides abscessus subsp. bolletii]|uniref:hypothetical protein n=1 Tax=Mycobacteroides abscessus TaxID=36809 RepID=UPI00266C3295|nr:hypothetical protein [Mycobacteroides abscessus]MDO3129671.1 hypothetical protein [Mycobacteroides abscessus subsp. bolletii]
MTVKAWLDGDPIDLRVLASMFTEGDVRVLHDNSEDAYYLTAPNIDSPAEVGRFDVPAEELLRQVNGLARARNPDFRPALLTGRYTNPSGTHVFAAALNLELRISLGMTATVLGADGESIPDPPSPWPDRLALAAAHPDTAEVLAILGSREPLGWVELYKIHEIIRNAIKPDTLIGLGWSDKTTDSAFTASANRKDVSGDTARHARNSGASPTHTMTLPEGRSCISDLVTKWLAALDDRAH